MLPINQKKKLLHNEFMKRLQLAPLLIALAGCSSDLVVKTDLGEKYLVKDSAVITVPNSLDDLISVIKKDALKVREKYRRCVVKYGERKEGEAYSYCERTYAFFNGFSNKHSADLNLIELSQKNAPNPVSNDETLWYDIRFRPIFIDLNKKKNAGDYELISCLRKHYFTTVLGDKYLGLRARQPKEMSSTAYESMKAKVCDKYAKF